MMYNIAMKKLFIFLLIFNIAYSKTYRGEITDFELVRVRDGDTFVINILEFLPQSKPMILMSANI